MASQEVNRNEIPDFRRDFQESSARNRYSAGRKVARGAGFEPARPEGPQA